MKEKYKKAKRKSNYYWSYSHLFAYMNSFWYKPLNLQWGGDVNPKPSVWVHQCFIVLYVLLYFFRKIW